MRICFGGLNGGDTVAPSHPEDIAGGERLMGGMRNAMGAHPDEGTPVITYDRRKLGVVAGSDGNHFCIRSAWGRPYWLSCNLIRSNDGGQTMLNISKDVVPRYKVDATTRPIEQPQRVGAAVYHASYWMLALGVVALVSVGFVAA